MSVDNEIILVPMTRLEIKELKEESQFFENFWTKRYNQLFKDCLEGKNGLSKEEIICIVREWFKGYKLYVPYEPDIEDKRILKKLKRWIE